MQNFCRTFDDNSILTYRNWYYKEITYVGERNQTQLVPKCTCEHKISKERNDVLRTTLLCDNDVDIGSMRLANDTRLCSHKIVQPTVYDCDRVCTSFTDLSPQTYFRQIQKDITYVTCAGFHVTGETLGIINTYFAMREPFSPVGK